MSGDNGWFQQNCDPNDDPNAGQQEVPSGGGPVNTGADGTTPAEKTVNQVIENLLGQCYPSTAPQTIRNFVPEGDDSFVSTPPQTYDFGFLFDRLKDLGMNPPNAPTKVQFQFPNAGDPNSGGVCLNDGEDTRSAVQCEEDFAFQQCIKDHIDCIFRPYAGGAWKPPAADCDVFSPKSSFGVTNKICVRNCVPLRTPVFEHVSQGGAVDGAYNHRYSLDENTPPGYITSPGATFYLHLEEQPKSVPLYVAYSSSTQDTMLTTDPAGEKSTMDSAGMGPRDQVIGYVYKEKSDIISALGEGEKAAPLYRYYNPVDQDHRYTLTPIGGAPLEANLRKGYYNIRHEVEADLKIEFNCERGSAGYKNTFGYYLTNSDGDPVYGQVVLPNATDATGYKSYTIPQATLNQYVPCRLGFVLIPDGDEENSGVSEGDNLSFSETGNGWRTNLDSAEDDLSFFSEKRLNWDKKDFTKWTSRWWQYWEDLKNGDDDYDDVKISYRLNYAGSDWFYEGIQCYVFEDLIVPEYEDLSYADQCEGRIFEPAGFSDVQMTREGCGQVTEEGFGCGKCEGKYQTRRNKVQTITAKKGGTVSIRSHGGMTGGYGECIKFKWNLQKNGTEIYSETSKVEDWRKIGEVFHTFSVAEGDDITFELESIKSGHYNASATPAFSLKDETSGDIFSTWECMLTTVSHGVSSTSADCGKPGQISLVDLRDRSNSVVAWVDGSGVTGNWLETTNRPEYVSGGLKLKDGDTGVMIRTVKKGLSMQIRYEALSASQLSSSSAIVFDSNGDFVNGTPNNVTIAVKLKWDDNVRTAGLAITDITAVGADGNTVTWNRGNNSNSGATTKTITLGPGTTNVTYNGNAGGFTVKNNNTLVCLKDTDGNDCNGEFTVGEGGGGIRYKVIYVYDQSAGGYSAGELQKWWVGTNKKTGKKFNQGVRIDTIDGSECAPTGRLNTFSFGSRRESAEDGDFGIVPPVEMVTAMSLNSTYYDSCVNNLVNALFTTDLNDSSSSVSNFNGEPITLASYWRVKNANNEPVYFYHDFVLEGPTTNQLAKVRMRAELIYKEELIDNGQPETNVGYQFRWTVDSVRQRGYGYIDGQETRVEYPERADSIYEYWDDSTPYNPEQTNLPKKIKIRNAETDTISRTAKWAMYQESHDNTSTIWYSNLSRSKNSQFRDYRFIIEDAT